MTTLTFELLDALRDRWAHAGMRDLLAKLQPGVSAAEAAATVSPLGLRLPEEVRTWFAWHDGGQREMWCLAHDLWPLSMAAEETRILRQTARDVREDPDVPEADEWQPDWFAFTGSNGRALYVDTSDSGATSRVYRWHDRPLDPGVSSLGMLVELAIEVFDSGYFKVSSDGWDVDEGRWPAGVPRIF